MNTLEKLPTFSASSVLQRGAIAASQTKAIGHGPISIPFEVRPQADGSALLINTATGTKCSCASVEVAERTRDFFS